VTGGREKRGFGIPESGVEKKGNRAKKKDRETFSDPFLFPEA